MVGKEAWGQAHRVGQAEDAGWAESWFEERGVDRGVGWTKGELGKRLAERAGHRAEGQVGRGSD